MRVVLVAYFCCVLVGLALVWAFSPQNAYPEKSIAGLSKDCSGAVRVSGVFSKVFVSSNGNLIGILSQKKSQVLVFLKGGPFEKGDRVTVFGSAGLREKSCWVFPDLIERG